MKKLFLFLLASIALFSSCNSSEIIVEQQAILANKQCPMSLGSGLTLTKVENNSNYFIYYYEGDSNLYSYSQNAATEELKNQVAAQILSQAGTDAASLKFINALIELNKGIIYHYYTSSGTAMDVVIEADRLYSEMNSEPVDIDVWENSEINNN